MSTRPPDPDSLRYEHYWAPVLAGPAQRLLERVVDAPGVCLGIGAGTGTLTLAAAGRWPRVRIISLDASAGMLSVARGHAAELWPADAQRFDWLAADAAAMPLADGSVDLAVSSFALQVVDDRRAVLAEARRVLRSGGQLAFVTWIADDLSLAADDAFDGVVAEFGLGGAGVGFRPSRTTDYTSLDEARAELSAAGFDDIDVRSDTLRQTWTREDYLEFKERYDEREVFEDLDDDGRDQLRDALRARWANLPDAAFEVSGPLVSALARKPLGR